MTPTDTLNPWNPLQEKQLRQELLAIRRNIVDARRLIAEWEGRMNEVAVELDALEKRNRSASQGVLDLRGVATPKPKRGAYAREKRVLIQELKARHIGKRMRDACDGRNAD